MSENYNNSANQQIDNEVDADNNGGGGVTDAAIQVVENNEMPQQIPNSNIVFVEFVPDNHPEEGGAVSDLGDDYTPPEPIDIMGFMNAIADLVQV